MSPRHCLDLHLLPSPTVVAWRIVCPSAIRQKAEDASPASGAQRPPRMGNGIFIPETLEERGIYILGKKYHSNSSQGAKLEGAHMRNFEYE